MQMQTALSIALWKINIFEIPSIISKATRSPRMLLPFMHILFKSSMHNSNSF